MTTTQEQTVPTVTNGVNVTALFETIDAVKQNTDIANFRFQASNRWLGGDSNRSEIAGFYGALQPHEHARGPFEVDNAEPPILLGDGAAPNPVEYVLHALAGCLTTTMVYHAAARGMEIEEVSSELEGDLDLRGFLGLSTSVRKGFHQIRVKIRAKSEAKPEDLRALAQYSPVYDIVSNSLPVDVVVETHG